MAQLVEVTDPGHLLLGDFVALNDPVRRRRVERSGGYFVVEGVVAIEQLLTTPQWSIRSLALLPRVAQRLAHALEAIDVPVAVATEDVLRQVVGFDLHRGALASVARVDAARATSLVRPGQPQLLLAAEGVNDHENLGALYRNAGAFGATGVLLDPTSADPFYRRSIRVSSGQVLRVPTGRLAELPAGLAELHDRGATTVALTPAGDIDLRDLGVDQLGSALDGPVVILVGAEGPGLTPASIAAAHHRVAIDLTPGVDSINVATAAAIAAFHLSQLRGRPAGR